MSLILKSLFWKSIKNKHSELKISFFHPLKLIKVLEDFDQYFLQKEEPNKGCLLALQTIILSLSEDIAPAWKYKMPFYYYRKKMFCYIRVDKKTQQPYIGVVEGNKIEHPLLEKGDRSRMKILLVDPNEDLPVKEIKLILKEAMTFYK